MYDEVNLFVQAPTRSSPEMSEDSTCCLAQSSEMSEDKETISEKPSPVPVAAATTAPRAPAPKAGMRNNKKKNKNKGKKHVPDNPYASPTIMAGGSRAFRSVRPTGCNVKSTGKPPSLSGGYKAAAGMLA